jgi:nitroreductase
MRYEAPYLVDFSARSPSEGVDELFYKRWSPRSFKKTKIPENTVEAIIDAARWTPSCFNDQPWLIVTSTDDKSFDLFLHLLIEKNQLWAKNAALLGLFFARRHYTRNEKPYRLGAFDCGAAWMALTLQANKFGLYTHGMAGINLEETYTAANVSRDEYQIMCGFAIGVLDTPEKLPEEFRDKELPSTRRPLSHIWKQMGSHLD